MKLALAILGAVVTGKGFGMEAAYAWNRWDAPHYIDIAKDGYVATGENSVFIAFFPLFPLLMKAMSFLTGEYFIAGSIVSPCSASPEHCFMSISWFSETMEPRRRGGRRY